MACYETAGSPSAVFLGYNTNPSMPVALSEWPWETRETDKHADIHAAYSAVNNEVLCL